MKKLDNFKKNKKVKVLTKKQKHKIQGGTGTIITDESGGFLTEPVIKEGSIRDGVADGF